MDRMDEKPAAKTYRWSRTSEDPAFSSYRHVAECQELKLSIRVDITHCMGETDKTLTVVRNGIGLLMLVDPFLPEIAFTSDFSAMVQRGDRELWTDLRTGAPIQRPVDHDIAGEVPLLDLIPDARDPKKVCDKEVGRFYQEVLSPRRHDLIATWDDEKRRHMVRKLLAEAPGIASNEFELAGIMMVFSSWQGPVADETEREVQAALATWPPERLKFPHWFDGLDWKVPNRSWRFPRFMDLWIARGKVLNKLQTLVKTDHLPRVNTLTVKGTIGAQGGELLAGWPGLAGVKRLELKACDLGDAGASALAASPHLGVFERVEMSRCGISDAGAVALASALQFTMQGVLDLSGNDIGDEGAMALARQARRFNPLKQLDLSGNRIGPAGVKDLFQARYREPAKGWQGPCVVLGEQRRD